MKIRQSSSPDNASDLHKEKTADVLPRAFVTLWVCSGAPLAMRPRQGFCRKLVATREHRGHLLPGPILEIGNTNSRHRFLIAWT